MYKKIIVPVEIGALENGENDLPQGGHAARYRRRDRSPQRR